MGWASSAGSRMAVGPPPGTRPNRRDVLADGSGGASWGGAAVDVAAGSAATFFARGARAGRGGRVDSATGVGGAFWAGGGAKGSSVCDGATAAFLTADFLAAAFLTVDLLAAIFLLATFLAGTFSVTSLMVVFVAAFFVTRLRALGAASALPAVACGWVSSLMLLLIRNRVKRLARDHVG